MNKSFVLGRIENGAIAFFGLGLTVIGAMVTQSVLLEIWRYRFAFSLQSVALFLIASFPLFFGALLLSQSAGWKTPHRIASSLVMFSVAAFAVHAITMITWAFVS